MSEIRRPRVLICDAIHPAGIAMLHEHMDVDDRSGISPTELIDRIANYDAIIVRSTTQVTAEVIEHGLYLKVIARAGAGLDNVDVVAAKDREIEVVNSPDANSLAVAEHTMGLMLAVARQLPYADLSLKAGKWEKKSLLGISLAGKTLGIVGFGRIGREVALRAQAFGMKVIVNQRRTTPELTLEANVESVDLNELLDRADFITLHVPSRSETQNMIGAEQIARMKKTAYLINTARGDIVDEPALLAALNKGGIAGAALDVFVTEPATDSALAQHPRVIATPHIASSTDDAQRAAAVTIADKLIDRFAEVEVDTILPLRIVPANKVFPHEHYDPKRVARLAQRLEEDMFLANPPIVMEMENGYMVLDGATRSQAMKSLKFPHMIVQLIHTDDGLRLHTWFHVVRKIAPDALMDVLKTLPQVVLEETTVEKALDAMFDSNGLCYMEMVDRRVILVRPASGSSRLEALNAFTNTYIEHSHVSRTLESSVINLQHAYDDMTAVVIFPEYTVQQVMQAAQSGRMFPAGITRFVIPGRVLRLNADLHMLQDETRTLREKNRWLHDLLSEKEGKGRIRYYEEPIYLLDE